MSHFTVLVIGEDLEGQLAPYDEQIEVTPYKQYADSDQIAHYESLYREKHDGQDPEDDQVLVTWLREEFNYHEFQRDQTGIYEMSTYNPKSKWDWYSVGGRWTGYFVTRKWSSVTEAWNTIHDEAVARGLDHDDAGAEADEYVGARFEPQLGQPGAFHNEPTNDADVCVKGDVDVEAMRSARIQDAEDWWDRMDALCHDLQEAKSWDHFVAKAKQSELDARNGGGNVATEVYTFDQARTDFNAQPRVAVVRKHDEQLSKKISQLAKSDKDLAETLRKQMLAGWDSDHAEHYQLGRDGYVQMVRDSALPPYAYVKDGEWFAPGKMMMFGASTDNLSERLRWNREFNEMFDRLPATTKLTLVDCHI